MAGSAQEVFAARPCKDPNLALLRSVKRSQAYRTLRHRFAGSQPHQPSERWVEGGTAYFIFDLMPAYLTALFAPLALFAVRPEDGQLLLARVITPAEDAREAHVTDIYRLAGDITHDQA